MRSLPAFLLCGVVLLGGCAWWDTMTVRSQSPDEQMADRSNVRLVGDLAGPAGNCMFPVEVGGVSLVTGLHGTGGDPIPSRPRQLLLGQMQARGVESPNRVLASLDTALVLVRGVLPAGIQAGDRFDLEVRIPPRSETSSLRGGWLLETELREYAVMSDRQLHSGHLWGRGVGPVMVDPTADAREDRVARGRGRILGGAVALKSRPLGLELKPESRSVWNSSRIETAVNRRFHSTRHGIKAGMAKAKTERYLELGVHPRYKDNIARYMRVVRAIALRESEAERQKRLALLDKQLLDPITSSRAALQLEAIGHQAIDVLRRGIEATDPEVRFHAAEALAYLDQSEAAEPLAEAARQQPAFRVFALSALSAMDDVTAAEKLRDLLSGDSAETRYGAFRALSAMNRKDPAVMGEQLGGQFSYHVLETSGTPMIHVTRSRRPEIVLFGKDQRLHTPLAVDAGCQIMVVGTNPDRITVSKFAMGEMDQRRVVSNRVDDVIRAVVELGGTYPDIVQALQEAKEKGALSSRFEVDAVPEAGRTYDRVARGQSESGDLNSERHRARGPFPQLFTKLGGRFW